MTKKTKKVSFSTSASDHVDESNKNVVEKENHTIINTTPNDNVKINKGRVWFDESDDHFSHEISNNNNNNINNNKDSESDSHNLNVKKQMSSGVINKSVPAFLKQSHMTPSWAMSDAQRAMSYHEEDSHVVSPNKLQSFTSISSLTHPSSSSSSSLSSLSLTLSNQKNMRKRFRSDGLDALLARTEPLLEQDNTTLTGNYYSSAGHRVNSHINKQPSVLSTLPLPRDAAHTIHWHRNGQLVVVGGNIHLYTFHAAGSFVEQLNKIYVGKATRFATLTPSQEELVFCAHQSYLPSRLTLATEQIQTLPFLDMRNCAIYRHNRPGSSKNDFYIRKLFSNCISTNEQADKEVIGVVAGRTLRLASLHSGSILTDIVADDFINDAQFTGPHELMLASGNTISVYDVRKTAHFMHQIVDEGALTINTFACTQSIIATGSVSGVVNVFARNSLTPIGNSTTATAASINTIPTQTTLKYSNSNSNSIGKNNINSLSNYKINAKPIKTLKNLTTPIMTICFGLSSATNYNNSGNFENNLRDVMAFSARGQKSAFRIAYLPECNVLPSFPAVAMRHDFVQALAMAPTVPVLSVGERQKVTNYAL